MYKTILVYVDAEDPGNADRLQYASALAATYKARLVGVAAGLPLATVEILASGGAVLAGGIATGDPNELKDRFAASESEFKRWTKNSGLETGWKQSVDFPAEAINGMAGMADLIVIGGGRPQGYGAGYMTADRGDVVMQAGRPVLTVPQAWTRHDQTHAVVAWKNTREGRRALADSLPMLARAEEVSLFHVREDSKNDGIAFAKSFLAGHCIGISESITDPAAGEADGQLLDFAARSQASLIVAGAYGHSRFREWALGGVTRTLLQRSPVSCLFSH